ncbi:MAG TPA: AraC family transcriptional regulator [Blastocatellia bacterium]|nr:AraC family transcriptional regulator [Blastocatellia bacterium]
MTTKLPQGGFFGRVVNSQKVADFLLNETVNRPGLKIPKHSHENSYFCLVLRGTFKEVYGTQTRLCSPLTFAIHPPDELHSEEIGNRISSSFNIEICRGWLARMRQYSVHLDSPAHFQGGPVANLALKLYREYHMMDSVSPLAIEGLILEIIAEISRQLKSDKTKAPQWLSRVREILHDCFADGISLDEIATTVDIHPVHLAASFRQHYRCTVGEYIRQLRLECACRELAQSNKSLAQIAVTAGFVDQSHLSRTLKNMMGITPAQYRSRIRLN